MVRTRNCFIGDTTDYDLLPADARPGTFFFNTDTHELFFLSTDGVWYSTTKYASGEEATEVLYHYHEGV